MRRFVAGATVVVVLAGGAVAGGGAATAGESYKSRVTIREPKPGNYRGRVISDKAACERRRLVTVFADPDDGPPVPLSEDRTDRRGRWEIEPIIGEEYYATVKRARKGSGESRYTCRGDRSRSI